MAISITLKQYLADNHIVYDELLHERSYTALETAEAAHISGNCIVKAVLLSDGEEYLLATLPASRRLELARLCEFLDNDFTLATEEEASEIFGDCDVGALPAAGDAYGLEVVWDDALAAEGDVYFEGGDHETLIHVDRKDFERMMAGARHAHITWTP